MPLLMLLSLVNLMGGSVHAIPTGMQSCSAAQEAAERSAFLPFKEDGITGTWRAHEKREFLQRQLRAIFYYTCPVGGRLIREFEWHAAWRREDQHLWLHGVTHIDHFGEITTNPPDFWAEWDGFLCTQVGHLMCSYVFTGRTEGSITDTGIVMSLVTDSNHIEERPKVSELCYEIHPAPANTCPAVAVGDHNLHDCVINHIDVHVTQ